MPFSTYTELQTAVATWLARGDLTAHIPDFIALAERDITARLNLPLLDKIATGTMTAGQAWIDLPADYVDGDLLEYGQGRKVDIVSRDKASDAAQNGPPGMPVASFVHGTQMRLAPGPGSDHAYTLFYRGGVESLATAAGGVTALLTKYPNLHLYGALFHATPFLGQDQRLGTWGGLYRDAMKAALIEADRTRFGHGPMRMRPDRGTP